MSLTLMRHAWSSQPHPDLVDGGLDHLPRGAFSVHRKLRTDHLDEVGAGERRLLDLLGHRHQTTPIKRCPRGGAPRLPGLETPPDPAAVRAHPRATRSAAAPTPTARVWPGGWPSAGTVTLSKMGAAAHHISPMRHT